MIWLFLFVVMAFFAAKYYLARKRYQEWVRYLNQKYNNDQYIVKGILNNEYWENQTTEQLLDSIGTPDDTDKQVMKTKTKEVWKYGKIQRGQYSLRINIENNTVVGWDKKSQ